jgi:hypothetical protein
MAESPHAGRDFVRATDPRALEVLYEIQRRMPPGQKLANAFDLGEGLFEAVRSGIRRRPPNAGGREVFLRAVATRVPRKLMIKAYGGGSNPPSAATVRPRPGGFRHVAG